jgi:antitoxin (DNA-binding transcriptional repressor) of toxin-antitoxin stability system
MAADAVKVSDLKNRLSHYLRQVRNGATLLVTDRDHVIARIEPAGGDRMPSGDEGQWLERLERQGTIRRAPGPLPRGWRARRPKVRADVLAALLDERSDGR